MVARQVEEQVVVEHRQRPAQPLADRHRIAAGPEHVRMVQRQAAQPLLAAGDGQEELPVAHGQVGLEIVDQPPQAAQHARGVEQPPADLADDARDGYPAVPVDGAQHGHLVQVPPAPLRPQRLGYPAAADEVKLVLGHEPFHDGLRAHDVAVGVAHHAVEDSSHRGDRLRRKFQVSRTRIQGRSEVEAPGGRARRARFASPASSGFRPLNLPAWNLP